jgi:hypothetical protein
VCSVISKSLCVQEQNRKRKEYLCEFPYLIHRNNSTIADKIASEPHTKTPIRKNRNFIRKMKFILRPIGSSNFRRNKLESELPIFGGTNSNRNFQFSSDRNFKFSTEQIRIGTSNFRLNKLDRFFFFFLLLG